MLEPRALFSTLALRRSFLAPRLSVSDIPGDGLRRVPGIPPLVAVANGGTHLIGISDRGAVLTWGQPTLLDDQAPKVPCAKCVKPLVQAPGLKVDVP